MATSGANPSTTPCVNGVPVVQGYPCPPPPPPPPPSTSGGATHDQNKCRERACNLICLYCVTLPMFILFLLFIEYAPEDLPTFKLDSVSISAADNITALCDIGYSIDRTVGDLQVWARFMSRDYKVESNGSARNSTVSVSVPLPRGGGASFPSGVTLELVAFKSNNYVKYNTRFYVEAVCMDIPVQISATRGLIMLLGGPRLCPVVYNQRL